MPLDFSASSEKALQYAIALGKTCGAQLHLVHVCDYDGHSADFHGIPPAVSQSELTQRSKRKLGEIAGKYGARLAISHLHVVSGRGDHEICRIAGSLGSDAIVIATRGRTGLKRVVLSSTAERVVQHAPCPVLVVREREREILGGDKGSGAMIEVKRILLPLDFSACSLVALEFAIPWAHFWKAKLLLFHSLGTPRPLYDEFGGHGLPMIDSYADKAAQTSIRQVASRLLERGVAVETAIETGPPARQICDYAERKETDLIIISTHGATGLLHFLMGSTAEHVVRHAHCPVLVVPARHGKRRNIMGRWQSARGTLRRPLKRPRPKVTR